MSREKTLADQILAIRGRGITGTEVDVFFRLKTITRAFGKVEDDDYIGVELLRYFPIALVACIESFFRDVIGQLIDAGEPYLGRSTKIVEKRKYDADVLVSLHGQRISVGELIAHHVRINNTSQLIGTMDKLWDGSYKECLSQVQDRFTAGVESQGQPIIRDVEKTFRHLDNTFRYRHVFCHEAALAINPDKNGVRKCVEHTEQFLKAAWALASQTLLPDAPRTQVEMTMASAEDCRKEREILGVLLVEANALLSDKQEEQMLVANEAWDKFVGASVTLEGLEFEGGTIRPQVEYMAEARFAKERQHHLRRVIELAADSMPSFRSSL